MMPDPDEREEMYDRMVDIDDDVRADKQYRAEKQAWDEGRADDETWHITNNDKETHD